MMLSARTALRARGLKPSLVLVLVALVAAGCDDTTGPGPVPDGGYAYTGFGSDGAPVVAGWLTLDTTDPAHVTGTWRLEPVGNAQNIGPQTGNGRLEGRMDSGTLAVDLNPGFADNNVFLEGTFAGKTYRGRWTYSSFAGVVNAGTFQGVQR